MDLRVCDERRGVGAAGALASSPTSVDHDGVTGNQRGSGGSQKDDGARYIHWLADAVQGGNAFDDVGAEGRVGETCIGARSFDEGWSDAVDCNTVLTPFHREALSQVIGCRLGGAVNGLSGQSHEAGLRTYVNDAAAVLANHDACGGLAGEEGSFDVDGEREVEICFADVFGQVARRYACVVDKNIQAAKVRHCFVNGARDLAQVGHVHLQRKRATAKRFNFTGKSAMRMLVAQTQRNIGAGVGQGE